MSSQSISQICQVTCKLWNSWQPVSCKKYNVMVELVVRDELLRYYWLSHCPNNNFSKYVIETSIKDSKISWQIYRIMLILINKHTMPLNMLWIFTYSILYIHPNAYFLPHSHHIASTAFKSKFNVSVIVRLRDKMSPLFAL